MVAYALRAAKFYLDINERHQHECSSATERKFDFIFNLHDAIRRICDISGPPRDRRGLWGKLWTTSTSRSILKAFWHSGRQETPGWSRSSRIAQIGNQHDRLDPDQAELASGDLAVGILFTNHPQQVQGAAAFKFNGAADPVLSARPVVFWASDEQAAPCCALAA